MMSKHLIQGITILTTNQSTQLLRQHTLAKTQSTDWAIPEDTDTAQLIQRIFTKVHSAVCALGSTTRL